MTRIILHIGAHRTGTTSLQAALSQRQKVLQERGTALWLQGRDGFAGARPTRAILLVLDAVDAGKLPFEEGVTKIRTMIREIVAASPDLNRAESIVMSEENLIGSMQDLVRHGTYHTAARRLECLARALGDDLERVVLTIRQPEIWFASAVRFVARKTGAPHSEQEKIVQSFRSRGFRWSDTADRLQAVTAAQLVLLPLESPLSADQRVGVLTQRSALGATDLPHLNKGNGQMTQSDPPSIQAYEADLKVLRRMDVLAS